MNITQQRVSTFGYSQQTADKMIRATRVRLLEAVAYEISVVAEPTQDIAFTVTGKFYNAPVSTAIDNVDVILEWEATIRS
jgi:hypothetical protein